MNQNQIEIPYHLEKIFSTYKQIDHAIKINNNIINALWYQLENVKGIQYNKLKFTFNKDLKTESYYQISEQIDKREKQNSFYKEYLKAINKLLTLIDDSDLQSTIKEKFIQ